MSKSYGNTIEIFGDPRETRARIMRVVTDSRGLADPKTPETCNAYALWRLFASESERAEMEARYRAGGLGYGTVKKDVADRMEAHFAPLRKRREEFARDPERVETILRRGAERARKLARETLAGARRAVGLE
jgi:tryptophanyl-tRNA synthetase